jgi:hypothetical protein
LVGFGQEVLGDFATCIQSDVRVGLSWVEDDRSDLSGPYPEPQKWTQIQALVPVAKCQMPSSPLHETWVAGQVSTPMSKIARRHE